MNVRLKFRFQGDWLLAQPTFWTLSAREVLEGVPVQEVPKDPMAFPELLALRDLLDPQVWTVLQVLKDLQDQWEILAQRAYQASKA
jgi:hypothetical protein